jgi:RNA ligase (TIGR02306 family)
MSSFEVTLERITVRPHPNADRLELARVGLFDAVIGKGQFQTGDVVIYIPEQAILPQWLISKLNLDGKLNGKEKNRVKAVSLRGALSQGIVAPLDIVKLQPEDLFYEEALQALASINNGGELSRFNFAVLLDIQKWQPEVPIHMSGEVVPAPDLLPWIDIENIKRFPDIFTKGDNVSVTEKLHGTCTLATVIFNGEEIEEVLVTSKGFAEKRLVLVENPDNLYWRAVNGYPVREMAEQLCNIVENEGVDVASIGIYGETYGAGIQDLAYGETRAGLPGFAVFDAYVKLANGEGFWVMSQDVNLVAEKVGMPVVPVLFEGEYDIEHIASIASGKEQMSGTEANIREGVVIRSAREDKWIDAFGNGHRKIAKFVTEEYLTRKGGTEFQ